jgi:hypothetical protein
MSFSLWALLCAPSSTFFVRFVLILILKGRKEKKKKKRVSMCGTSPSSSSSRLDWMISSFLSSAAALISSSLSYLRQLPEILFIFFFYSGRLVMTSSSSLNPTSVPLSLIPWYAWFISYHFGFSREPRDCAGYILPCRASIRLEIRTCRTQSPRSPCSMYAVNE